MFSQSKVHFFCIDFSFTNFHLSLKTHINKSWFLYSKGGVYGVGVYSTVGIFQVSPWNVATTRTDIEIIEVRHVP